LAAERSGERATRSALLNDGARDATARSMSVETIG
jgi:hypothetical protein